MPEKKETPQSRSRLEAQPNVSGYIKRLIREDIEREKEQK